MNERYYEIQNPIKVAFEIWGKPIYFVISKLHASFAIITHENDVGVMVCHHVFSYVPFTLDVIF